MAQKRINLFELISEISPYLFLYGCSVTFDRDPDNNRLRIKIKDLMIKDETSEGIIIENLVISLVNLKDGDIGKSIQEAGVIVEHFNVLISEAWVNTTLQAMEKQALPTELNDLRVSFHDGVMSFHGAYKKGINFGFTTDLKFSVIDDRMVIDFDRFWVGSTIPMPQLLQKTLLNYLQGYLTSHKQLIKGVRFFDRNIFVDHLALLADMVPMDMYVYFRNIYVNKGFLVLQGGADFNATMEIIKHKDEEMRKADLIMQAQLGTTEPVTEIPGGDGKTRAPIKAVPTQAEKGKAPELPGKVIKGEAKPEETPEVTHVETEMKTKVKMPEKPIEVKSGPGV